MAFGEVFGREGERFIIMYRKLGSRLLLTKTLPVLRTDTHRVPMFLPVYVHMCVSMLSYTRGPEYRTPPTYKGQEVVPKKPVSLRSTKGLRAPLKGG